MKLHVIVIAWGIALLAYPMVSAFVKKLRQQSVPLGEDCPLIKTRDKVIYSVIYVTLALCFPFKNLFGEQTIICRVLFIGAYFSLMYHYFVVRTRLNKQNGRERSVIYSELGEDGLEIFLKTVFFAFLPYAFMPGKED